MNASIRTRLLIGTAAGTAGVLLCAGLLLYWSLQKWLWGGFDAALAGRAAVLASVVEQDGEEVEAEFDYRAMPEFTRSDRPEYFRICELGGEVIVSSPSLAAAELQVAMPPAASPVLCDLRLPDGRAGRCVSLTTLPRVESPRVGVATKQILVVLAKSTSDIEQTLARIGWIIAGVLVAAATVSALLLYLVVGRGLRPLDQLAARISRLRPDQPSERVQLDASPRELTPVVDQTNALLGRVEAALQREKGFSSDVAHELRTPLAGLRSTLEVSLSRDRQPEAYRSDLAECLKITGQMQGMVDNLLCLARLDRNLLAVHAEPVCLKTLLLDCWRPFAAAAQQKSAQLEWQLSDGLALMTDSAKLRHVLTNLLDNAVSYVDSGGRITVAAESCLGTATISISNTGSRLDPSEVPHVFERFWRGDGARQDTGHHCGLGLPLARRLLERLGGSIEAETGDGVFRVYVRLAALTPGA